VLQCVAVCCNASQSVAECCRVLQCVAERHSVLQCVAVYVCVISARKESIGRHIMCERARARI